VNQNLVAGALAVITLAVVIGGIVLALRDKTLPGELIAIGSATAGALASSLTRRDSKET